MNTDTYHRIASRIPDESDRWATAIDLAEYVHVIDDHSRNQERIDFVYECMRDEIRTLIDIESALHTFLCMAADNTIASPDDLDVAASFAGLINEPVEWVNTEGALVSESGWVIDLYRHNPYMVTPDGQCVLRFTDTPNRFPAWIKAQVAMWKVPA